MNTHDLARRDFLRTLVAGTAALYFPYRGFAQQAPASIQATKLTDTITMLSGTDGDTYVFFPEANIVQTGDLFWNGMYPVIDYSAKGWIGGMIAAADQMGKVGDANTRIIPGHGPLGTKADLNAFRDMLATVHERLEPMARQGKTIEEVLAASPTKDLDATWGKPRPSEGFLRQAYPSLVRHNQKS